MAVFLYHGPYGPKKQEKLKNILSKIPNPKSALFILPDQNFVENYKTTLLTTLPQVHFLEKNFLSWKNFLFGLVKKSLHHAYKADDLLSSYLIFLLLCQKNPSQKERQNLLQKIKDLQTLFVQWKRVGLDPKIVQEKFRDQVQDIDIINIFEKYQNVFQKLHLYDEGDLTLTVLNLLKQGKLSPPEEVQEIFLVDHYPLDAGQREILRLLKKYSPKLTFHIFYDEDFDRHDDLLSQAYEDLGSISDHAEYLENPPLNKQTLYEFPNPFEELAWVTHQLKNKLEYESAPHGWGIVTSSSYAPYLERFIEAQGIPFASTFPQSLNNSFFLNETSFPEGALNLVKKNFPELSQKLKATQILQTYENEKNFLKTIFSDLRKTTSPQNEDFFFEKYQKTLITKDLGKNMKVLLCDVTQALAQKQRHFFLTGLFLENLELPKENPLLSQRATPRKELAELFALPNYQYKILLEKTAHLLKREDLIITSSKTDFSGKPTTPFLKDCLHEQFMSFDRNLPFSEKKETSFTCLSKKIFSITELQTYLQCPYKYYASYHLHLGEKEKEDLELKPNQRGNFVHHFLQSFFEKHKALYEDFLKTRVSQEPLFKELEKFLSEQAKNFKPFEILSEKIVTNFLYRLQKTLEDLFLKEKILFQEEKKTTLPSHFEWKIQNFYLPTKFGPIQITGRIDRIDRDKKQITIIDYKTGNAENFSQIQKIEALQLPLYAMAIEHHFSPKENISGALYYELKTNHFTGFTLTNSADQNILKKTHQISKETWQELTENVTKKVEEIVENITKGKFDPLPQDLRKCSFCDYRRICGYKESEAA